MSDAYWTMNTEYIESRVVVAEASCTGAGCCVESDKVTAYCPRCGTALSDAEVAMGYQTVEDPSVFVRFRAAARSRTTPRSSGASLLVWTTTPWTLPSNERASPSTAGAAYVVVERRRRTAGRWRRAPRTRARRGRRGRRDPSRIRPRRGPLRAPVSRTSRARTRWSRATSSRWRTAPGSSTSRRRSAPEDLAVGRAQGWPVFKPVDDAGRFNDSRPAFVRGLFVKDADPKIVEDLTRARRAPARGDDRARVPVLLAVRHAAPLLRALGVVRAHHRGEGAPARGERVGQLVPRPHQARPLRRLAREQRGLGAVARAVLGHAAADLAVRGRAPDRRRLARGARRARRARRRRRRPASPRDRRGDVPLSGVRRRPRRASPR